MVSEEIRRQNTYWVNQRNKWRKRYSILEQEIKVAKNAVRMFHSCGDCDAANMYHTRLLALQIAANDMMIDRSYITIQLKETSYRYV